MENLLILKISRYLGACTRFLQSFGPPGTCIINQTYTVCGIMYSITFTQEMIELDSTDHSMVVLDMAVANDQHVVEGEPIDDQGTQSVVVLSSYEDWSPEEKLYIVELAKTQNLDAICQLFGLSAEVVCSWVQENEGSNETFTAPVILSYPEELDIALRDWVLSEQSQYKFISTKMLQEQASLLIQPQCPDFNPSMAWLHQFLVQNGLALQLSIPSEYGYIQCIIMGPLQRGS